MTAEFRRETIMERKTYKSVDEYIGSFPENIQKKLTLLREVIKELIPGVHERIRYRIPCFYLDEDIVYFAAHSNYIGFYPTASGIARFKKELSGYEYSKETVKFPYEEKLPMDLIKKIIKFKEKENGGKGIN